MGIRRTHSRLKPRVPTGVSAQHRGSVKGRSRCSAQHRGSVKGWSRSSAERRGSDRFRWSAQHRNLSRRRGSAPDSAGSWPKVANPARSQVNPGSSPKVSPQVSVGCPGSSGGAWAGAATTIPPMSLSVPAGREHKHIPAIRGLPIGSEGFIQIEPGDHVHSPGVKSRMCLPYPKRVLKDDWMGRLLELTV